MNTIEYYLRQLDYFRKLFITNLRSLGIECDDNEKYNTLIPKVYKLATSGEVLLPSFSIYGFQGSQEEIDYIFQHCLFDGTVTEFNLDYAFNNVPNLDVIPLYKYTGKIKNIKNLYSSELKDEPISLLDAHGCDFSNLTGPGGYGNTQWYGRTEYDYKDYKPPAVIDIRGATLNQAAIECFTENLSVGKTSGGPDGSKVLIGNNKLLVSKLDSFFGCGNSYSQVLTEDIDLSDCEYKYPISEVTASFSYIGPQCTHIDLGPIEFADNVRFYRSLESLYCYEYPFDTSKLEGKNLSGFSLYAMYNLEEFSLPACNSDQVPPAQYCNYLKKLDLSNVTITGTSLLGSYYTNKCYFSLTSCGSNLDYTTMTPDDVVLKLPSFEGLTIEDMSNTGHTSFASCIFGKLLDLKDVMNGVIYTGVNPRLPNYTNCYALTEVDTTRCDFTNSSTGTIQIADVRNCKSLKKYIIHLPYQKSLKTYMYSYLYNIPNIEELRFCNVGFSSSQDHLLFSNESNDVFIGQFVEMPNLHTADFTDSVFSNSGFSRLFTSSSATSSKAPNLTNVILTNSVLTTSVTKLTGFLTGCKYVDNLDFSGWDASKVISLSGFLKNCNNLTNMVFMNNLGKGYTVKTANYYTKNYGFTSAHAVDYNLDLSTSPLLTYESLMDVINKVYDLNITYGVYDAEGNPGTGVLYTQQLKLGADNLAKLTPEEIAIATSKGWTVS